LGWGGERKRGKEQNVLNWLETKEPFRETDKARRGIEDYESYDRGKRWARKGSQFAREEIDR
jgi:hypothetical protein